MINKAEYRIWVKHSHGASIRSLWEGARAREVFEELCRREDVIEVSLEKWGFLRWRVLAHYSNRTTPAPKPTRVDVVMERIQGKRGKP